MTLKISHVNVEGSYQGSKFLKYPIFLSKEELEDLFSYLEMPHFFPLTYIDQGEAADLKEFFQSYGDWIEQLKKGEVPKDSSMKKYLAGALTVDENALFRQEVAGKRFLVKIAKPVVQVQSHFFTFSQEEKAFYSMTMGKGSIFWGLLFSFPQIYQDGKTMEFLQTTSTPNYALFEKIKVWVRNHSRPTPFIVDQKRINVSMRIGKKCLDWIHMHPQLKEQNLEVYAG